jgi:hypothetical protein
VLLYRGILLPKAATGRLTDMSVLSIIDTDEFDSDTNNVEEEVVEFFIKEEITVIE